jgi:hypothetical protein
MNNKQPIFTETAQKNIWQRINEITLLLMKFDRDYDPFLMYGEAGIQLFLFHRCFELDDEECYAKVTDKYFQKIDNIHKKILYINDPQECNACLADGLGGIGWMLDYMIRYPMIEADLFDVMGSVDPKIFRRMVYDIQEDRYDLRQGAAGIALYCVNRNERFPREYLNRFIAELYKRMTLGKLNNIQDYSIPSGLSGLYLLVRKIRLKYPDMDYIAELADNLEHQLKCQAISLKNTLNTLPGWSQSEAGVLWSLLHIPETRDRALEQWAQYGKLHLEHDHEYLEAGLYGGSFSLGHLFNRIYRLSGCSEFRELSSDFLHRGLSQANYTDEKTGCRLWYTEINGVYGVHYGLLGGLAGIGLALLAAVSEKESGWDESLLLS